MSRHTNINDHFAPRYVVWELTLKCDLACRHCGSRAGRPREEELSVEEAFDVVLQLKDLGAREITFIGGEAYLYPEWLQVVRECANLGMRPTMTTGGRKLPAATCQAMKKAGMSGVSVSINGLESTHWSCRGKGFSKGYVFYGSHVLSSGLGIFEERCRFLCQSADSVNISQHNKYHIYRNTCGKRSRVKTST